MTTPQETIWEIEPHTLAKHEILRRYLGAWFPILGTYNHRIVYIDGFSGPGRYKGGEIGSPIIAIQEALKQSQRLNSNQLSFIFLDERADRIEHLKRELSQIPIPPNFYVAAETGQFDCELKKLLDALESEGARLLRRLHLLIRLVSRDCPLIWSSGYSSTPKPRCL
jgi:three-Cys-motif partner protein